MAPNTKARASAWRSASALSNARADESGWNRHPARVRPSSSRFLEPHETQVVPPAARQNLQRESAASAHAFVRDGESTADSGWLPDCFYRFAGKPSFKEKPCSDG